MATYVPPKVNTQLIFYDTLVSQADTKLLKSNPTIASGDFKVSTDGGAFANLGTLPTVTPASSVSVKFTLSTSEMNGANVLVAAIDAAGAEWCDKSWNFQTAARQVDDLAYPATSGRSILVDATGNVDARLADAVSHGGTLGSGTATLALSRMSVVSQSSNTAALTVTGNGSGNGATVTGGATGIGLAVVGGGTSGDGIKVTTTSGHGINLAPVGTDMHGLLATGGNGGTSDGVKLVAGTGGVGLRAGTVTVTGATVLTGNVSMAAGLNITQSSANTSALVVTGNGTGSGAVITSGSGATGDGVKMVAASTNGNGLTLTKAGSGSDFNATVTPLVLAKTTNITGFNDIAAGAAMTLTAAYDAAKTAATQASVDAVAGYIDTEVAAIKAKTDNLPAAPAAVGDIPSAATIATAVWGSTMATGVSALQAMRGFIAAMLGKASGLDTTTAKYRNVADDKDVISATVDANGNRTAVTLDLS